MEIIQGIVQEEVRILLYVEVYVYVCGVFVDIQTMEMTNNSWSIIMSSIVLLVALVLPGRVCTYNVFVMPFPSKSHVFSMAAITEGLADRGHKVTFFIAENFRVNLPELQNRTEISVVRYRDTVDGQVMDYDAIHESLMKAEIEFGGDLKQMPFDVMEMYVNFL